jgi:hypothetical protein
MSDRPRVFLVAAFVIGIGLAVGLLLSDTGASAMPQWRPGAAVPSSLAAGVTVVDRSVPVEVAPQTTAWTGSELLTLGVGPDGRNVGAVYRPNDGRWRSTTEIPFGTALRGAESVWTGRVWVVTGVLCDPIGSAGAGGHVDRCDPGSIATAGYDPKADMWRVVDDVPWPVTDFFTRGHDSTFGSAAGRLGDTAAFQISGQYYALHTDSWDWQWLPQPSTTDPAGCSVRGTLFTYDARRHALMRLVADAIRWTASPRAPEGGPSSSPQARVACSDSHVYVSAPDSPGVMSFDVRRSRWSDVPSLPARLRPVTGAAGAVWIRPNEALAISPDGVLRAYRAAD